MSLVDDNIAFVRRHFDDFVNRHDLDAADRDFAPDFLDHDGPGGRPADGPGGKRMMAAMQQRYPDLRVTIEDIFGAGDRVACRNVWRGTDRETGAPMSFHGIVIWRLAGGRMAERWATVTAPSAPTPSPQPPAATPAGPRDLVALGHRFATEVLGGANPAAFDELVDPDVWVSSGIAPAGPIRGRDAHRAAFAALAGALSNFRLTIEDVMPAADGERVAVRWRGVATHTGAYLGMAPTGRRFVMVETHVLRWRDGRVVENYVGGNNPPTFEVLFAPVLADAVLPRQHSDDEVGNS